MSVRSIFTNPPWGRYDMGRLGLPWPHPELTARGLGQEAVFSLSDWLERVGIDPSDIEKVADPRVRAEFKAEFDRCRAKAGLDDQIACLGALGLRVYAKLEEEARAPAPPPPTGIRPAGPPPTEGFPVVPVAIAAAAGGALIYLLTQA